MPDEPNHEDADHRWTMVEVFRLHWQDARLLERLPENGQCIHLTKHDPGSPTGYNGHTHSLPKGFGHPDFQVILPLPAGEAYEMLTTLAGKVRAGQRFAAGTTASGILQGYDVGFADATEGGRDVLRVIIPDPEGRTARGEIGEEYAVQYLGTTE